MSLLAKLFNFQAGTPAVADDVDAEIQQILDALNSTSTTKNLVTRFSGADAPYVLDQLGAGPVQVWRQSGSDKLRVNNNGALESLIATGAAPLIVASTTKVSNLNVDLLDGLDSAAFAQLASSVAAWSKTWFYPLLPGAVETVESVDRLIVPPGTEIKITDITSVWAAGADSGASNVFTIKRRNAAGALQGDVGTIDVNSGAQDVLNVNNIGDVSLVTGDQIYPMFTTRNTGSEQLVSITIRGTQRLT